MQKPSYEELEKRVEELEAELRTIQLEGKNVHSPFHELPQKQLDALLGAISDVIIMFDGSGRYLKMAPVKPQMEYMPVEDMIGKSIHDILPENVARQISSAIKRCLLTKQAIKIEYSLEIKGRTIWYDGKISPLKNENVLLVGRNITVHKANQQRIKRSEARLKAIFNNHAHAFVILTPNYQIESFNSVAQHKAKHLLGIELKKSDSFEKRLPPNFNINSFLKKALNGKTSQTELELDIEKEIWLEIHFSPIKETENQVTGIFISLTDISKRKQAEHRLQKSKANLKAMFDSSSRIYILISTDFEVLSFNRNAVEFATKFYTNSLEDEKDFLKILPENQRQKFKNIAFKVQHEQKVVREKNCFPAFRSYIWFEYTYLPALDDNNQLIGVAMSIKDITKEREEKERNRRQMIEIQQQNEEIEAANEELHATNEELKNMNDELQSAYKKLTEKNSKLFKASIQLKEGEQRFRRFVANSTDGVAFVDEGGIIIEWNKSQEAITGISRKQAIGKQYYQVISSLLPERFQNRESQQELQREFFEFQKTGQATWSEELLERIFVLTDGNTKTIQQVSFPIKTEKGFMIGSISRDITEKKKFEEALKDSEAKNRALLQLIPDMIFLHHPNGKFLEAYIPNGQSSIAPKEEIIGKQIEDIFPPDLAKQVRKTFEKAYKTHEAQLLEYTISQDGKKQAYEARVLTTDEGEILSVVRNITSRRKAEQALKESELRLRDMNQSKDKFFSIIAHDLKNPFNNVMGLSEILVNEIEEYSRQEIHELITLIYQSSNHGYSLLENLLEWSRSQTGRIRWQPEKTSLKQIANQCIELLDPLATTKKIRIEANISENIKVFIDSNMITTVLRNLISNALKFTENNGCVKISATPKNDFVEVQVTDTGIGISQKDIPKLFRIDINHSTVGTASEKGTGLGLIICKEFVEKHKGKIWVKSQLGKGSQFHFTLPGPQHTIKTLQ